MSSANNNMFGSRWYVVNVRQVKVRLESCSNERGGRIGASDFSDESERELRQ